MDLKELGFTKEQLQDRVVDQVARRLMESVSIDENGDDRGMGQSAFACKIEERVRTLLGKLIDTAFQKHVGPNVAKYVENLTMTETNRWGEKTGKSSVTFIEYLVARAEAYIVEEVNYQGKTQKEDSYSWKASHTRIAHMIHEHLHYSIAAAMKKALDTANGHIAAGIKKTVEIKLAEVLQEMSKAK